MMDHDNGSNETEKTVPAEILNKTRRIAIANGTCVSICNQPKTHFGLHGTPLDNRGKCYMLDCWSNA